MSSPNRNDKYLNNKKIKYRTNGLEREKAIQDIINTPDKLPTNKNRNSNNIVIDNNLRNTKVNDKKKMAFVLDTDKQNKCKDYRNFGMTNISRKDNLNTYFYTSPGYKGQGTGFSIEGLTLRNGQNTRQTGENITGLDMNNYRFNELYRNYQITEENNRGGIDTRNLDKYSEN